MYIFKVKRPLRLNYFEIKIIFNKQKKVYLLFGISNDSDKKIIKLKEDNGSITSLS